MTFKHGRSPRLRLGLLTLLALGIVAAAAVPLAFANTATPTSSQATWRTIKDGRVLVTVRGKWNWITQSCAQGAKNGGVSHTDVNGHYAIGFAGSWNDSTTPNTLTGKATNGQAVTLHVGNRMDRVINDYCKSATAANPYPVGRYRISHVYSSMAAFRADVPNARVCVNGYDIHQPNKAGNKDWNPGTNGDNTLKAGQYVLSAMCFTATPSNPAKPGLSLLKLEHVSSADSYERGPVTGNVEQTVYYQMLVKNTGNVRLDVTLRDRRCDSGTLSPSGPVTLAPGESASYYCQHVLTSSDVPRFVNVARALGKSANASASARSSVEAESRVVSRVVAVAGKVKVVRHKAKPAKPVVHAASFTG